jgi:hypothetical protein
MTSLQQYIKYLRENNATNIRTEVDPDNPSQHFVYFCPPEPLKCIQLNFADVKSGIKFKDIIE